MIPVRPLLTGTEWLDTVAKQLASASPGLIDVVRALSPWETGGGERLWAIHELDRVDRHGCCSR